jgi:hypothetical protein
VREVDEEAAGAGEDAADGEGLKEGEVADALESIYIYV